LSFENVDSGVRSVDVCFEGTKAEDLLVSTLRKMVPQLARKEANRLLNGEMAVAELEEYLPLVKECIPSAEEYQNQDWKGFYTLLGEYRDSLGGVQMKGGGSFPKGKEPSTNLMASVTRGNQMKAQKRQAPRTLRSSVSRSSSVVVAAAYKSKA
jgi:hypothetical protein